MFGPDRMQEDPKTAIYDRTRKMYPVSEYGYIKKLFHKGAVIKPSSSAPGELELTSNVPRKLVNGKYEDGFDCIEAAYVLYKELRSAGMNAKIVRIQNPLFRTGSDVAVESDGSLMTLVPGVDVNGEVKKIQYYTEEEYKSLYESRRTISDVCSNKILPMRYMNIEGSQFMCSFGIYTSDQDTKHKFEMVFAVVLVKNGKPVKYSEATVKVKLEDLAKARQLMINGKIDEAFYLTKRENASYRTPYNEPASEREYMAMSNALDGLVEEVAPQVLKILDKSWAVQAAK